MLKTIRILFLGLVVCAGSACVTPTHASSAPGVLVTYVQASGPTGAKDEIVVLHNTTTAPVNVTNWCLLNKAGVSFVCLAPQDDSTVVTYYLGAQQSIALYSHEAASSLVPAPQVTYAITNQSSGSIVNGGDTLTLVNADHEVIDTVSWQSPIASGKALARRADELLPGTYSATGSATDWQVVPFAAQGSFTSTLDTHTDDTSPGDDDGGANPGGGDGGSGGEGSGSTLTHPYITELLANPIGSDTGAEFIELYNPSDQPVALNLYRLRVTGSSEKIYAFPEGSVMVPHTYRAFYNSEIKFSLTNSGGHVQLLDDTLHAIGDLVSYQQPKEGESWALVDTSWQFTSIITPGAPNAPSGPSEGDTVSPVVSASSQKPCADNQFRNPETGRCKRIAAAKTDTPCKEGQVRSAETNRCRSLTTGTTEPAACKENQERNPETNRCRTIKQLADVPGSVKGVQTAASAQLQWYYWVGLLLVVGLVVAYGVWEWREELRVASLIRHIRLQAQRLKTTFTKRSS